MPYINVAANIKIQPDARATIKSELGRIIEMMPGKMEKWLMVSFEDEKDIYFGGDNAQNNVFTTVKMFGREQDPECYDKLTEAITDALSANLGIEADRIYIEYESTMHWGWNGKNFRARN